MKKYFLIIAAAFFAFAACQKPGPEGPVEDSITVTSDAVVNADVESSIVNIAFNATTAWTASVVDVNGAVDYAVLDKESGEKGDNVIKLTIRGLGDATEGRVFQVLLTAGTASAEVTIFQGAVFFYHPTSDNMVGPDGGTVTFEIITNQEYEVKTYDGEDGAFAWAPVTRDGNKFSVAISENKSYNARDGYVKFTCPGIQVPVEDGEGETEDRVFRAYFYQDGLQFVTYSLSMYDMDFDTWGTTVLSEAFYKGKHYVSNGQDLYEIDPANGAFAKKDWFCGTGMTQKFITTDDAGHLIVCNHTAYNNDTASYTDGYFILSAVKDDGTEQNIITKAAWECGGPFGARLVVKGDIFGDAIIVAPVEGIDGVTMSSTLGYWEVSKGVIGDYQKISVTGFTGTWSCAAWNTYPNNFPTIIPKGLTASAGFLMSGCYEDNNIFSITPGGEASILLKPNLMAGEYDLNGNVACQSMDVAKVAGVDYLVIISSPHFPTYGPGWSGAPYVSIHNLVSLTAGANIYDDALFSVIADTYFPYAEEGADDAISVAADVNLYEINGHIGVSFADLNGRCVQAYEIDPAI